MTLKKNILKLYHVQKKFHPCSILHRHNAPPMKKQFFEDFFFWNIILDRCLSQYLSCKCYDVKNYYFSSTFKRLKKIQRLFFCIHKWIFQRSILLISWIIPYVRYLWYFGNFGIFLWNCNDDLQAILLHIDRSYNYWELGT